MKIYKITIAVLMFFTFSCKDFLEEKVISDVSYDHYQTAQGIESGVGAAYNPLRTRFTNEFNAAFQVLGTDIFMEARDASYRSQLNRYEATLNAEFSDMYQKFWINYYKGINTTNFVIDAIEKFDGEGMSVSQKNSRAGELHYLRGLYYFFLVQTFGDVPLVIEPDLVIKTDFTRTPTAEVYNHIISDLRKAVEYLPESQTDYGRATKGAAQHLLGLVYLTRASAITEDRGQKPTDLDSAAYFADEVINSGMYQLEENFIDLWDMSNQKNDEVIFSVQFSSNELYNNTNGNWIHLFFGMTYDLKPGMKRTVEYGRPWNRFAPTKYAITELYDRKNDSRFYKTFQSVWYSNNLNNIPKWVAVDGFTPPAELLGKPKFDFGDTAVVVTAEIIPDNINIDSLYASKPYYYMPINRQNNANFFVLRKHLDPTRENYNDIFGRRDGLIFRLAESYLIAAEAYGRKGDFNMAVDRLNVIRHRAAYKEGELKPTEYWKVDGGSYADRLKSTEADIQLSTNDISSNFVDFMLDERARELNGELRRWWDLVRCEKLVERVKKYNPGAPADNIQEYHKLRPVPQQHIDLLDPRGLIEEEQNPGYY